MKLSIKKINGKKYLYAVDTIYITRGISITKNKSLGRADRIKDIGYKKQAFHEYLIKEETNLRTDYWSKKVLENSFKYISVKKLESLRSRLYRFKQTAGDIATSAMEMAFLADFIFNSNRIEGSKLPRERVEEIIKEKKSGNDEVNNTIQAIGFMDTKFLYTKSSIKKLHSILLKHEPSKLGFRKEPVVVGNMEVLAWEQIEEELSKLLQWYNEHKYTMYPPELAFTFYYKFERIHPFEDGNGRTGRLIMNDILKRHRYHPIIIWNKRGQSHLHAFKKAVDGKQEYFHKFMADQFEKTYEIYLEKIERAYNLEKQINYFMQPSEYNFD